MCRKKSFTSSKVVMCESRVYLAIAIEHCPQAPKANGLITTVDYKNKKRGCLTSACFCSRSSTTHAINRQRNTHVGVYDTSVKCAWRYLYPQHTTESIYYTLRGIICTFVLDCIRFVEVSNSQKQSVSNAFSYVVLCPSVTLFHQSILGRCKRKNTKTCLNRGEKVQKVFMHKIPFLKPNPNS